MNILTQMLYTPGAFDRVAGLLKTMYLTDLGTRVAFGRVAESDIGETMDRLMFGDLSKLDSIRCNIEKIGENNYCLSIPVAGFAESDLNVEVTQNKMTISGQKEHDDENRTYLRRDIPNRFEQKFNIGDDVRVTGARYENGTLYVDLTHEVPEMLQSRRVEIISTKPVEQAALDIATEPAEKPVANPAK